MPQQVAQYLFYQHNVQQFFLSQRDKYGGVMVPLSIATSFPTGTYGFVRALLGLDKSKIYAIDPRTALFQKKWDRVKNLRPPHTRMAKVLGAPVSTDGISRALVTGDFADAKVLNDFTDRCLNYQKNFRTQDEHERKLAKYKKLAGLKELPEITNPQVLIPPYFEFSSLTDAWYQVNIRCIAQAMNAKHKEEVRPVLHVPRDGLAVIDWNAVGGKLKDFGAKSVFIYPNEFREHDASSDQLKGYIAAVVAMQKQGIKPYALHGGYFAILLSLRGLAGFGNGVGYGEWRDSGYHKGGSADKRIYFPMLHKFISPQEGQLLLGKKNGSAFCSGSDLLKSCVANERLLDTLEQEEILGDFLKTRAREIANVSADLSEQTVLAELSATLKELEKVGTLETDAYGSSLKRWGAAFQS